MGAGGSCCGMTRRRMLGTAGAAGAAALGAAGCGGGDEPEPQDALMGDVVAQTDEVPEGGGTVIVRGKLVLTQPEKGDFRAFSAVCTHSGCTIQEVEKDIHCLCHGSRFDLATGEPVEGPATEPLKRFDITVDGSDITLEGEQGA